MLKRLLTAIVVFPVSFIVVGLLTPVLIDMVRGPIQGTHFNFSGVTWSFQAFVDAANTLGSTIQSCLHFSLKDISIKQSFVLVFALVGAVIFFLSYLSEHLYVMLLPCRRFITMPLVFGHAFLIFGPLLNLGTRYVVDAGVQATAPDHVAEALTDFHAQRDSTINVIVLIATALLAFFITFRLIRWDGLPWCRAPLPVSKPHRTRNAL